MYKIIHYLITIYIALVSLVVFLGAIFQAIPSKNPIYVLFFIPVPIYVFLRIFFPSRGHNLLLYYCFMLTSIMAVSGFIGAKTIYELLSAALFLPLCLYFWTHVLPKNIHLPFTFQKNLPAIAVVPTNINQPSTQLPSTTRKVDDEKEIDLNRRNFLKLIGSAGIFFFLLSIFSNRVENTLLNPKVFPGLNPVPNPANSTSKEETPTITPKPEGYQIAEIDDSTPSYFGFTKVGGAWYIMQENDNGSFRYTKGDSDFPSNWERRSDLKYVYYDQVFWSMVKGSTLEIEALYPSISKLNRSHSPTPEKRFNSSLFDVWSLIDDHK